MLAQEKYFVNIPRKDVQKSLQVPGYNCIQKDGYVKLSVICRNVIATDGRMYSIKGLDIA